MKIRPYYKSIEVPRYGPLPIEEINAALQEASQHGEVDHSLTLDIGMDWDYPCVNDFSVDIWAERDETEQEKKERLALETKTKRERIRKEHKEKIAREQAKEKKEREIYLLLKEKYNP